MSAITTPTGLTVTAENWQSPPQLDWAFQHVADLFPTAPISRGAGPVATLTAAPAALSELPVHVPYHGGTTTFGAIIDSTWTDGWAVLHRGQLVGEAYPRGMGESTRHILMSVSKSIVGSVVGILASQGTIDLHAPLSTYIPALVGSGYAEATTRQLLDMRSGIAFSEDYLDVDAEVRLLDQAIGWAPKRHPDLPGSLYDFLATLKQKGPHGGPFEYRSCETDVLGWLCEAVTGVRMPLLLSHLVWSRIGAEYDADIGLDATGAGMYDGGISAALRDLLRFGTLLLHQGASLTGEQVLPPAWVADCWAGGPDSREAFALSPSDNRMPGGMYRNQYWFPYPDRDVLLCLGIHGQMIYVNPAAEVVAAKLSSWPAPQDAVALFSTTAAFDAVSAALSPV